MTHLGGGGPFQEFGIARASGPDITLTIDPELPRVAQMEMHAGNPAFIVTAMEVERRLGGTASSRANLEFIDTGGDAHRSIIWGSRVRLEVQGRLVFGGFITMLEKQPIGPTAVRVGMEMVGLEKMLYHIPVLADNDYGGLDTVAVAEDVVLAGAIEFLDGSDMTNSSGVTTPLPFNVAGGESIAAVFERLVDMDGFTFWVNDSSQGRPLVQYRDPFEEGTQLIPDLVDPTTVRMKDLRGWPTHTQGTHQPRNLVRILDSTGADTVRSDFVTRLHSNLSSSALTIRVQDNTFANAAGGFVRIGNEKIAYSGKGTDATSDFLTVASLADRGIEGTDPSTHIIDALVLGDSAYTYGPWMHEEGLKDDDLNAATVAAEMLGGNYFDPGFRLELPLRKFHADVTPYALLNVDLPRLGITDDALSVSSVRHTLQSSGGVLTTVTCGDLDYNITRQLEALRKRVSP